MIEEFRVIEEFPNYKVSNFGRVFSGKTGKVLKPRVKRDGYEEVRLYNGSHIKERKVHKLVATYFIDNLDNKPVVNHIDGNKLNNHYMNLEWVTYSENSKHYIDTLGGIAFEKGRVETFAYDNEKDKLYRFDSQKLCAEFCGVSTHKVRNKMHESMSPRDRWTFSQEGHPIKLDKVRLVDSDGYVVHRCSFNVLSMKEMCDKFSLSYSDLRKICVVKGKSYKGYKIIVDTAQ